MIRIPAEARFFIESGKRSATPTPHLRVPSPITCRRIPRNEVLTSLLYVPVHVAFLHCLICRSASERGIYCRAPNRNGDYTTGCHKSSSFPFLSFFLVSDELSQFSQRFQSSISSVHSIEWHQILHPFPMAPQILRPMAMTIPMARMEHRIRSRTKRIQFRT